jgi:hypothetical protein
MVAGPQTFAEAIDVIEATYEFMLAYAAQGCRREDEDAGSGIRERLMEAEAALGTIASSTVEAIPAEAAQAAGEFLEVVKADAVRARTAFRFVLAQRAIGSQVVDNLNATTHVRTLLTDLFLLDEAAKISGI